MEAIDQALGLFGVDAVVFGMIVAIVYFFVEAAKRKAPAVFNGWKTDALTIVAGFLLSWKAVGLSDVPAVIFLTALVWAVPAGYHAAKKNGGSQ